MESHQIKKKKTFRSDFTVIAVLKSRPNDSYILYFSLSDTMQSFETVRVLCEMQIKIKTQDKNGSDFGVIGIV